MKSSDKYAVSNKDIVESLISCKNVVTKCSYEDILLNRCSRGDIEAGKLLVNWLKFGK